MSTASLGAVARALSWLGQAASEVVEASVVPSASARPPPPGQPPLSASSGVPSSQSGVLNSPELDEWHQIAHGTCGRALEGGNARGDPLPALEPLPLMGTRNVRSEELQKVFFLWTNGATARPVSRTGPPSSPQRLRPWQSLRAKNISLQSRPPPPGDLARHLRTQADGERQLLLYTLRSPPSVSAAFGHVAGGARASWAACLALAEAFGSTGHPFVLPCVHVDVVGEATSSPVLVVHRPLLPRGSLRDQLHQARPLGSAALKYEVDGLELEPATQTYRGVTNLPPHAMCTYARQAPAHRTPRYVPF